MGNRLLRTPPGGHVDRGSASVLLMLVVAALSVMLSCSMLNRQGPVVTCADLDGGRLNACSEGIIATCVGNTVVYEVCTEAVGGVDAEDLCDASWQRPGSYRCDRAASGSGGVSGSGGAGGSGGTTPSVPGFEVSEIDIAHDPNQDGVVSPGEAGYVRIKVRNTGSDMEAGVKATLTTTAPGVTLSGADTLFLGEVPGGGTACATNQSSYPGSCSAYFDYYPSFAVPTQMAVGTTVTFQFDVTNGSGSRYQLAFSYTVGGIDQSFTVAETAIVHDTNQDTVVSPGETGNIRIKVRNKGTSQAVGVSGALTTTYPGVTLSGADMLFLGDMSGGATACATNQSSYPASCSAYFEYYPAFSVPTAVPIGTTIPFRLELADSHGNAFSLAFDYTVGAIDQAFTVAETAIVQDSNQDTVVSPGENGYLRIKVRNSGSSEALGVTGVLSTTQVGVAITGGDMLFLGDVAGGATACATNQSSYPASCSAYFEYYPSFKVPTTTPIGTVVPFQLDLTDDHGNAFGLAFTYTVAAIDQAFTVAETAIVHDTNQNGSVSPGEMGYLRVKVRNKGGSQALGITGELTTSHAGITVTGGNLLYLGDIAAGGTACATNQSSYPASCSAYFEYYPSFTVGAAVTAGTAAPFQLTLTDEFGNSFPLAFSYTLAP